MDLTIVGLYTICEDLLISIRHQEHPQAKMSDAEVMTIALVAVLMDVFAQMIREWQISQHLSQPLTLKPPEQALRRTVPEIHHSDQGVQYLSTAYISTLIRHGIQIFLAHRGCPWENGYAERLIRTLKEKEVHLNDYEL